MLLLRNRAALRWEKKAGENSSWKKFSLDAFAKGDQVVT